MELCFEVEAGIGKDRVVVCFILSDEDTLTCIVSYYSHMLSSRKVMVMAKLHTSHCAVK